MCLLRLCFSKTLNSHWLPDDVCWEQNLVMCFLIMCLLRLCFSKTLNSHWLPDDDAAAGRWLRLRPLLGTRKPWSAGVTLHLCFLYLIYISMFRIYVFSIYVFCILEFTLLNLCWEQAKLCQPGWLCILYLCSLYLCILYFRIFTFLYFVFLYCWELGNLGQGGDAACSFTILTSPLSTKPIIEPTPLLDALENIYFSFWFPGNIGQGVAWYIFSWILISWIWMF